jgi:hypothetical protein
MLIPIWERNGMEKEKEYVEKRIPIVEWPDLERRMGVIARMTSEPRPLRTNEDMDSISLQSENENRKTRNIE